MDISGAGLFPVREGTCSRGSLGSEHRVTSREGLGVGVGELKGDSEAPGSRRAQPLHSSGPPSTNGFLLLRRSLCPHSQVLRAGVGHGCGPEGQIGVRDGFLRADIYPEGMLSSGI